MKGIQKCRAQEDRKSPDTVQLIGKEEQADDKSIVINAHEDALIGMAGAINAKPTAEPHVPGPESQAEGLLLQDTSHNHNNHSAADGMPLHRPPRLRIRSAGHTDIHAYVLPAVVLDPDQLPDFYPPPTTSTKTGHDDDDDSHGSSMQSAFDNRYDVFVFF
jgi:hypothetical protein